MGKTPLASYPYPSGGDAPYVASDLMALALAIDAETTLTATDSADRDARFAGAKVGTMVVSGASQSAWIKTGTGNEWLAIYEDTGKVTAGFTTPDDWTIGAYCFGRLVNHSAEIRAEVVYGGDDVITANAPGGSGNSGNISPDFDVLYVPPAFASLIGTDYVEMTWSSPYTGGHGFLYGSGKVTLRDAHPGSTISNGDFVRFSITFIN